jgi:hypothetical protein
MRQQKMVRLRCEKCPQNPSGSYCLKLKHPLENGYAMLYHGGAIGNYGIDGTIKYPSHCGIEKTQLFEVDV